MKTCSRCKKEKPASTDYFFKRTGNRSNELTAECKTCFTERIYERSRKQKHLGVVHKGGKCIICGYNKSEAALEFHHVDPSKKEFGFKSSWINLERLFKELDKCVLVCANCHREIHQDLHPQYLVVKDRT
jgi:predicted HNH restriction endonuclease